MEEEVKNSTDAAASKAAKKGYSIWSLMVIMTLLAVWLAIPRRATIRDFNLPGQYFFVFHQVTLWTIVGAAIWLLSGCRKLVAVAFGIAILIVWTPIFWTLSEIALTGKVGASVAFMDYIGLTKVYTRIYDTIGWAFGYEPN